MKNLSAALIVASLLGGCANLAQPPLVRAVPVVTTDAATDATPADTSAGACEPGERRPCEIPCFGGEVATGAQYCGVSRTWDECTVTRDCPARREDAGTPETAPADAAPEATPTPLASLEVGMAASPMSANSTRNSRNVPAVGLNFTAALMSPDVTVSELTLAGTGQTFGTLSRDRLRDVITSCALFDMTSRAVNGSRPQVGTAQAPDGMGVMHFLLNDFVVESGRTRALEVRCTTDSVVSAELDYFAIGVSEVRTASPANVQISSRLRENIDGSHNLVVVHPHGQLEVNRIDAMPSSQLVVPQPDVWRLAGAYAIRIRYEDAATNMVCVRIAGVSQAVDAVAIARDGGIIGMNTVPLRASSPAGVTDCVNVELGSPLFLTQGYETRIQIWVRLNRINAASGGDVYSGALVSATIGAGSASGEWNFGYDGSFNMRTIGSTTGDHLYASGAHFFGSSIILRAAQPIITSMPTHNRLALGRIAPLRFGMAAEGTLAWSSFTAVTAVSDNAMRDRIGLENIRLMQGATLIPSSEVMISAVYGGLVQPLGGEVIGAPLFQLQEIRFQLRNQALITGSGQVYTVVADVTGDVRPGDVLTLSLRRSTDNPWATGWASDGGVLYGPVGESLPVLSPAGLVWSDLSLLPHLPLFGMMGSADWISDVLVQGADISQETRN